MRVWIRVSFYIVSGFLKKKYNSGYQMPLKTYQETETQVFIRNTLVVPSEVALM